MIRVKRVYEPPDADDGLRFLVERLWPRGMSKDALALTAWLRDVSPSPALRRWYGHDPERWDEFQRRYRAELEAEPDAWGPLLKDCRQGNVTLLYSARDTQRNSALLLKEFLEARL
ncbi:MAG: DUF488 domain-containing protein [Bacillota bacterium]